jgi:hypothetical protein
MFFLTFDEKTVPDLRISKIENSAKNAPAKRIAKPMIPVYSIK